MNRLLAMLMGTTADVRLFQADGAGGGAQGGAAAAQGGAQGGAAGATGNAQGASGANGAGAEGGQGAGGNAGAGAGEGGTGAAGGGEGGERPWYEGRTWSDPALQQHLIKSGYHKGTAEEALEKALKGEISAVTRLGKNPGQLLDAPAEGQSFGDWLKANGSRFGVPDAVDKYDVKLPDGLPKDMPIDDALLSDYRAFALESGLPPALVQSNVDFWAKAMGGKFTALAAGAATAEENLTKDLQNAWGGNWKQNQQLAVRTFQALAADMKLAPETAKLVAEKLNAGMGDATLLKFFHSLGEKLGEDTLAIPRGGNAPALALAEAQQRKEVIMARQTGEMAAANRAQDQRRINELTKELNGLNTVIAQYGA
ncbi:M15 family metallopeptidase domain-containing protein [Pseudogemmobacter bohemicus]|uniref:hypothetical protein n=1 Tax=Pseudogemmobacter bohemicus TaxID=2250708 RepID=UPI0013006DC7|nr:hypothetical protein [Pseudogemmobacter bohemicus]